MRVGKVTLISLRMPPITSMPTGLMSLARLWRDQGKV
jgi:hypothetical protein